MSSVRLVTLAANDESSGNFVQVEAAAGYGRGQLNSRLGNSRFYDFPSQQQRFNSHSATNVVHRPPVLSGKLQAIHDGNVGPPAQSPGLLLVFFD